MTFHARLAAAGLMLAALGAGACSPEGGRTAEGEAAGAEPIAASADVHAFRIGALQAAALRDGALALPANDPEMSPWPPAQTAVLLTTAGVQDGTIHLSIQPLLVRDGERTVLIDAGAGGQMGTENRLPASLRAAGVEPGQVTDVLISHAHGDHIGGLTAGGALAFPNATIRMDAATWEEIRVEPRLAELTRLITPKVQTFAAGAAITPAITVVALPGHTAGHSGFEIASGEERLLYIGDALHSSIVSVRAPELRNAWDADSAMAIRTRAGLLDRGVRDGLRIYGVHFPFPGVGRFERGPDGFSWVPEGGEVAPAGPVAAAAE